MLRDEMLDTFEIIMSIIMFVCCCVKIDFIQHSNLHPTFDGWKCWMEILDAFAPALSKWLIKLCVMDKFTAFILTNKHVIPFYIINLFFCLKFTKNHVGWWWMKFDRHQTFHPTFSSRTKEASEFCSLIFVLHQFARQFSSNISISSLCWVQKGKKERFLYIFYCLLFFGHHKLERQVVL